MATHDFAEVDPGPGPVVPDYRDYTAFPALLERRRAEEPRGRAATFSAGVERLDATFRGLHVPIRHTFIEFRDTSASSYASLFMLAF